MGRSYRSAEEIVRRVIMEPGVKEEIVADPVKKLQEMAAEVVKESPSLEGDVWIYRIVVTLIGTAALLSVSGAIWIASHGGNVPDILTALGSGAIGALAGLLSPIQYRR